MNRREYLAAFAVASAGLAGCARGPTSGTPTQTATETGTTASNTPTRTPAPGEEELPIPESDLVRGAAKNAIPAITNPVFAEDWSGLEVTFRNRRGSQSTNEPRLSDDDRVIGVEREGDARAYPLRILNWHEVVNDEFHGPLLVTYCPLCGSGVTTERTVDGEATTFGVSGYLWRNDLVMFDERTDSLWSQIIATAIRGPKTGSELTFVPSTLTTWGAWRDEHPDTVVLRPPPESDTITGEQSRNYSTNPYDGYSATSTTGIGGDFEGDKLHAKAQVLGITDGDVATAYPLEAVAAEGVVNDVVGDRPVVVTISPGNELVSYERTVDGRTLEFAADGEDYLQGGDTRWSRESGQAVSGALEGARLTRANTRSPMYWFAWKDFHQETAIYGVDDDSTTEE